MPIAVILTAISVEYKAVRAYLTDSQRDRHDDGTIYERGNFSFNGKSWQVAIVQTRAGNTEAAVETKRAIDYFKPNVVLFVGVAGGIKDVSLGDVVAATKVYAYESGKVVEENFLPRSNASNVSYSLEQIAKAEADGEDWLKRIKGSTQTKTPKAHVGPIASGDKVLASKDSEIYKILLSNYGDALAVDMESHGVLTAVRANQKINVLIIRGISDLIDGKSEADKAGWQEIAASHASAFAFEILAKYDPTELNSSPSRLPKDENNLLYEALLSLNYREQVDKFEKFWEVDPSRQVGSFLVWGQAASCQAWLLNRLLHKSFHDTTAAKKIPVFLSTYEESYIEDLWSKLSKELQTSSAPQKLIESMYEHWQNETVIIVLHNLERMYPDQPKELIEKFWNPLVDMVKQHPRRCSSYLVMFLVDNKGDAHKWKIDFATDINRWEPSQPFNLQPISNFSNPLLNTWVQKNRRLPRFPPNNEQLTKLAKDFWENSREGIPELVMDKICQHCNSSWSNISKLLEV